MSVSILVLAAGRNDFESLDGEYPLCLTEFDGVSLIERIVRNTSNIENANYTFALLKKEVGQFRLDKVVRLLDANSKVVTVPESTLGSACTALLAACQVDQDSELLIISANEYVDVDFADFVSSLRKVDADAGTLVFHSIHPRYSYVQLDENGLVTEVAQQDPISNNATAGVFWFSKTSDFVKAAKLSIKKAASVHGKFYVAPTFNELILEQRKINVVNLPGSNYHPLKSGRQLQQFDHEVKS